MKRIRQGRCPTYSHQLDRNCRLNKYRNEFFFSIFHLHNGTVFTRLSCGGVADQHSEAVVLRAYIVKHLKPDSAPVVERKTEGGARGLGVSAWEGVKEWERGEGGGVLMICTAVGA